MIQIFDLISDFRNSKHLPMSASFLKGRRLCISPGQPRPQGFSLKKWVGREKEKALGTKLSPGVSNRSSRTKSNPYSIEYQLFDLVW